MKFVLIRVGNCVDVFVRCNLSDLMKLNNYMFKVFNILIGYKMFLKISVSVWNILFLVVFYVFLYFNCNVLYEIGN